MIQIHTKPKVITTAIHNLEIKGFNKIKNGREIDDRLRASYRFKRGIEEYHLGINSNDRTDTKFQNDRNFDENQLLEKARTTAMVSRPKIKNK